MLDQITLEEIAYQHQYDCEKCGEMDSNKVFRVCCTGLDISCACNGQPETHILCHRCEIDTIAMEELLSDG